MKMKSCELFCPPLHRLSRGTRWVALLRCPFMSRLYYYLFLELYSVYTISFSQPVLNLSVQQWRVALSIPLATAAIHHPKNGI